MVLPLSMMSGESWDESRQLLRRSYDDLVLISIAAARDKDLSFSRDTGMAECLVIGRKTGQKSTRATFVVLNERPSSPMTGSVAATQIRRLQEGKLRKLEDGPLGGSLVHFGDDVIGYAMDAPIPEQGPWNLARVKDGALAQVAYQMAERDLIWLPGVTQSKATPISIREASHIGRIGPLHWDITGDSASGGIRGPFRKESLRPDIVPTYPMLWSHDAERERCMQFEADSEGIVRQGRDAVEEASAQAKASRIWAMSSNCHFNKDFRFNSQSTGMQFTSTKTIGGHAWPSIKLGDADEEKALVLWGNSSLGLLLHWWHANKQQAGRGRTVLTALYSLPVLNVTALPKEALGRAVVIFDEMKHKELRPVNEIAQDAVRAEIDTRLATEVLGFPPELVAPDGPLALLRQKLALEPSITGSKSVY